MSDRSKRASPNIDRHAAPTVHLPSGVYVIGVPRATAREICGLTPQQFNRAVKEGRISPPLDGTETFVVEALRRDMRKWCGLEANDEDWGI